MKLRLLMVGRPRDAELGALHDRYASRISRFGVAYESLWITEVRGGGRFSTGHALEREAVALRRKLDGVGSTIGLDRRGRQLSSRELAGRLERWATPAVTFVVGGPDGLHRSILEETDFRWSLSELTFPHELARVLIAEQLYRALTVLRGHPYHR